MKAKPLITGYSHDGRSWQVSGQAVFVLVLLEVIRSGQQSRRDQGVMTERYWRFEPAEGRITLLSGSAPAAAANCSTFPIRANLILNGAL